MSDSLKQFKEEFGAILGKMTPEEIRAELESFGAEFETDKKMDKLKQLAIEQLRNEGNRFDLRCNGKLIFGISMSQEAPRNSKELVDLLQTFKEFIEAPEEEDLEIFPSGKTRFEG